MLVWAENEPAWDLFIRMGTQWRTAGQLGTRVGLDYAVMFARMDRLGLDDEAWNELFGDIQVMEAAAIEQMAEDAAAEAAANKPK